MNQNVLHIGFDVDDTLYHGAALNTETGEVNDCMDTHSWALT
ncbi:MAG: hypothetical protein AB2551_13565 [Candidatus Thiodiazotropha sp.]